MCPKTGISHRSCSCTISSKNSHNGGTSLIEFYSTLDKLGLLIEYIPSEVKSSVTEVTGKLRLSANILHCEKLKASNEDKNLQKSSLGDGVDGSLSIRDVVKGISRVVDVSRKVDSGTGIDVRAWPQHNGIYLNAAGRYHQGVREDQKVHAGPELQPFSRKH